MCYCEFFWTYPGDECSMFHRIIGIWHNSPENHYAKSKEFLKLNAERKIIVSLYDDLTIKEQTLHVIVKLLFRPADSKNIFRGQLE